MDRFIGILSGTSLDCIDVASYEIDNNSVNQISTTSIALPREIKESCAKIRRNISTSIKELGELDINIGLAFADAINTHLKETKQNSNDILAVGSHGITIYHSPDSSPAFTTQLGDPNTIAEKTGISVASDFRRRDVAAKGQGAPLAPLFHKKIFSKPGVNRVIVNIGGIANISILSTDNRVIGFDTGPGNCLIDEVASNIFNIKYDRDGLYARGGKCHFNALRNLLNDNYFSRPHPKSTGREYFNLAWLNEKIKPHSIEPEDLIRTVTELTARTISDSITKFDLPKDLTEIYICGGGANNNMLMELIQDFSSICVSSTQSLGVHHDWVESALFAWLAKNTLDGTALDYSQITNSTGAKVLGSVWKK